MRINKDGNEAVIRIPLWQTENNCYSGDDELHQVPNLIGVIAGQDYSISQLIDLAYKDDQQEGMPIIMFTSQEELLEATKILGLDVWTYDNCSKCKKALRGVHTFGDNGPECDKCDKI